MMTTYVHSQGVGGNGGVKPRMLYAQRRVKHYADDPRGRETGSVTGAKYLHSLEHQARYSLAKLQERLEERGLRYRIAMRAQEAAQHNRWDVYANGVKVAEFDRDFGYDCFDEGSSVLAERIWQAIQEQGIEPLTEEEVRFLVMYEKARKIVETETA